MRCAAARDPQRRAQALPQVNPSQKIAPLPTLVGYEAANAPPLREFSPYFVPHVVDEEPVRVLGENSKQLIANEWHLSRKMHV